jgi:dephospho-CoA kinase
MNKKFLIIGLTGGSGTGKTLISQTFLKHNIPVIDADKVSREVACPNSPCLVELAQYFGKEIIDADGNLKRRHLANIAFADSEKTKVLNKITHKYIKINIDKKISEYKKSGYKGVVVDAPTLIESGAHKNYDKIICVISKRDIRAQRIIKRDNLSTHEAYRRIMAQHNDDFYTSNSDYTIVNNDNIEDAVLQTEAIINDIFI